MRGTPPEGHRTRWRARAIPRTPTDADWAALGRRDRVRAERIAHPAARTRFVVGRAVTRSAITDLVPDLDGRALDLEPAPSGRLEVVGADGLQVSVSHTRGLAVAAAAVGIDIGIDVEPLTRDDLPPARVWLTAGEERRLRGVPAAARRRELLRLWVAKEATLKAMDRARPATRRTIEVGEHRHSVVAADRGEGAADSHTAIASLRWYEAHERFLVVLATAAR